MSGTGDSFESDRTVRENALARLKGHAESLKHGLEERPIKQRIADDVAARARGVASEAAQIANDSKPVIAGTVGLLTLWFLRKPIEQTARKWWPKLADRISRMTHK